MLLEWKKAIETKFLVVTKIHQEHTSEIKFTTVQKLLQFVNAGNF